MDLSFSEISSFSLVNSFYSLADSAGSCGFAGFIRIHGLRGANAVPAQAQATDQDQDVGRLSHESVLR